MSKKVKYLIIYLAVMISLTMVRIAVNEGLLGSSDTAIDNIFTILTQVVCMGMIPVVSMFFVERDKGIKILKDRLYLQRPSLKGAWGWIVLIAILHPIINGGISNVWYGLLRGVGYTPIVGDSEIIQGVGGFILALILGSVLPAVFEEVTHRGLVLGFTSGNVHKRAFVSALLFSLMHQNIVQTGYTFVGGLIMAYVVLYTGSIWPSMLIHFVNNALVDIRTFSSSHDGIISKCYDFLFSNMDKWWFVLILTIIWALAVVGVYFIITKLKKKSEDSGVVLDSVVEDKGDKKGSKILFIAIVAFGALTTIYSLIWGLLR